MPGFAVRLPMRVSGTGRLDRSAPRQGLPGERGRDPVAGSGKIHYASVSLLGMTFGETPNFDYLAYSSVKHDQIIAPREVYDRGILRHPDEIAAEDAADDQESSHIGRAHWSFDTATGWVILSDRPLNDDIYVQEGKLVDGNVETVKYKTPDNRNPRKQQPESGGRRISVPRNFFDFSDPGEDPKPDVVPESVRFENGERRHFVTAEEFLSDEPNEVKSCYVLTTKQLNTIINGDVPDDIPGGWTPRFI